MQTSNSIDNILASLKPDVINVKYLFDGMTKILQMPGNADLADLETKLLEVCHKMLYEINDIRIKDGAIAGSDELPFSTPIANLVDVETIVFQIDDRIINEAGRFVESEYNAIYLAYQQSKEDEKLAKQLQEDDYQDDSQTADIGRLTENVQRLQDSMMQRLEHATVHQLHAMRTIMDAWRHLGITQNSEMLTQIEQRLAAIPPTTAPANIPQTVMQVAPGLFAIFANADAQAREVEDDSDSDDEEEDPLRNPPLTEIDQSFGNMVRQIIGHGFEDVKVVNTKDEINTLNNIKYSELKRLPVIYKANKPCDICLEDYENSDNVLLLTCNHYYHDVCIKKWLENNSNKCPLCKATVLKGKAMITD